MTKRIPLLILIFFALLHSQLCAQQLQQLTKNGAWCWFSEPRAIALDSIVVTGWVNSKGSIVTAKLNVSDDTVEEQVLYKKLQKDDHNNPAFAINSDGDVLAMYTKHSQTFLFQNDINLKNKLFETQRTRRIFPLSRTELYDYRKATITYANPIFLENENKLYNFGRYTGFKPNIMWSDTFGKEWSKSKVFLTNKKFNRNVRPYVKYSSNGVSKIHLVISDGHPSEEKLNSIYYCFYKNNHFYDAQGNVITSIENIPFAPSDASVVYKATKENGRAWIADIGQDKHEQPIILFTKSPTKMNHEYWYASYQNGIWVKHKICDSGKWFPKTKSNKKESEPYYFGGMSLNPNDSNIVYLSRQIDGVFEIERWETHDNGKTWNRKSITQNSKYDNVRPFVPRNFGKKPLEIVLFMQNKKYKHYTKFKSSIKYFVWTQQK